MIIFRHYQIKKVMAGGPNLQGMDSLTAAMQNNIVPDQEYLLQVPFIKEDLFNSNFVSDQGSILDSKVDVLNHRLKGLCDNVDTDRETYDEKEMVFSIRGTELFYHDVVTCIAIPLCLGTATQPLTLRVRHSMDPNSKIPWQVGTIGQDSSTFI